MKTVFEMQQDAFGAIERQDDKALTQILDNAGKNRYDILNSILIRYSASEAKDTAIVCKLIEFPSFDQTSDGYNEAVQSAYMYLVANGQDARIDPKVIDALYEKISDKPEAKQRCLRFVFDAVASHGAERINVYGTKRLIEGGADCDQAAEWREAEQRAIIRAANEKLEVFAKLKKQLKAK